MCRSIISHRLRGFDLQESTLKGLHAALQSGILAIELDTRVTADKVIVINHDADIRAQCNSSELIANIRYDSLKTIPLKTYPASIVPLEEFLAIIADHKNKKCTLYLDIKESGYEAEIAAILDRYCMQKRTVIISWLPEVLKSFHAISPDLPLCFSHYAVKSRIQAKALQYSITSAEILHGKPILTTVYINTYNKILQKPAAATFGKDFEHIVTGQIEGELLELLSETAGYVCCPYRSISYTDVAAYQSWGVKTMVYAIDDEAILQRYANEVKPDAILSNNSSLCSRGSY